MVFQSFIYSSTYSFVGITETWLKASILDNEILPYDYSIYRQDRPSRGGGVLLAINKKIPSKRILSPPHLELVAVELLHSLFVVIITYLPPNSDVHVMTDLISFLQTFNDKQIILFGDFNLPGINWSTITGSDAISNLFCDFTFDFNLTQMVTDSTHRSGNCLDLVLSNCPHKVDNVVVSTNPLLSSDHFSVSFQVQMANNLTSTEREYAVYVPDFSKLDYSSLAEFLFEYDFSSCLSCVDVEIVWSELKRIISNAVSLFAPVVKLRKNKSYPKWYTPEIKHQLNRTRFFRKRAKLSPTPSNIARIQSEQDILSQLMISTKLTFEANLVDEFAHRNSNKIYKYINSILKNDNLPDCMYFGSQSASSDLDKATLFNKFFKSVYSCSDIQTFESRISQISPCSSSLVDIHITEQEVFTALSNLDPSKASGLDCIGPKILRTCCYGLYEVLTHLFSLSLVSCTIPQEWKIHCIVPVFKSGDKCSISNYRPISLLSSVSKVLERLIYDKLFEFLGSKISRNQFGFLKNHSSIQQLLCFLNSVSSALDSKAQMDVIYLDFNKAFDSVSHGGLLLKLRLLGINGNVWKWILNYLSNRQQLVSINGVRSTVLTVTSGVPQGSILGPLFFLVFINDLPDYVTHSQVHLFADDTKCSKVIKYIDDVSILQDDINCLLSWSVEWLLRFNDSKCIHMRFCSSKPSHDSSFNMSGTLITTSTSHKDLGIVLQENLKFDAHYEKISAKAYRKLGLLKRSFSASNSVSTKKQLYLSLVRSQLTYGSQVWRPMFIKHITALEQIQRRATKFILGSNSGKSYKERLISLNLLPLMFYLEMLDIMFFVNSYKNSDNDRFDVTKYVSVSTGITRSAERLTLNHLLARTNKHRHFYFSRISRLWNRLPPTDLSLSSEIIKRGLKDHLWNYFLDNFDSDMPCTFHFMCPCCKCIYHR